MYSTYSTSKRYLFWVGGGCMSKACKRAWATDHLGFEVEGANLGFYATGTRTSYYCTVPPSGEANVHLDRVPRTLSGGMPRTNYMFVQYSKMDISTVRYSTLIRNTRAGVSYEYESNNVLQRAFIPSSCFAIHHTALYEYSRYSRGTVLHEESLVSHYTPASDPMSISWAMN